MSKKNLVFIMTDHQRADSIFMEQDGKEVTPNLNNLAKESVNFSRNYTTTPLCVPARTSLATGIFPTTTGVVLNKGADPSRQKTIHEYLKEEGYRVAHTGIDHLRLEPELSERMEFDIWADEDTYDEYAKSKGIPTKRDERDSSLVKEREGDKLVEKRYSNARVSKWQHDDADHKDMYFYDKAMEFLDNLDPDDEKPFALFVYLWAPHPPLFVPKSHYKVFDPDNIDLPSNIMKPSKGESETRKHGVARQLAEGYTRDDWKEIWSAHLGLVNYADGLIGKILDKVKEVDKNNNTITLFTSDHGEHLGQHKMYQKMEMYEQAINVPWLINVPGEDARKIEEVTSHINILPTLLDFLDINHENLDGKSLLNVVKGKDMPEDKMVFSQYSGNQPEIGDIRRAAISKRYKYIYDEVGTPELYDLEKDPLEMENIAEKEKDVADKMHQACKEFFLDKNDWVKY